MEVSSQESRDAQSKTRASVWLIHEAIASFTWVRRTLIVGGCKKKGICLIHNNNNNNNKPATNINTKLTSITTIILQYPNLERSRSTQLDNYHAWSLTGIMVEVLGVELSLPCYSKTRGGARLIWKMQEGISRLTNTYLSMA